LEVAVCKFWHEDDYGRGLMEICKLTGRATNCSGEVKWCKCHSLYMEEKLKEVDDV